MTEYSVKKKKFASTVTRWLQSVRRYELSMTDCDRFVTIDATVAFKKCQAHSNTITYFPQPPFPPFSPLV